MNKQEKLFKKYCEANGFRNIEFTMPFVAYSDLKKTNFNFTDFIRQGEVIEQFDYLNKPPRTVKEILAGITPINLSSFNRQFLKRLKHAVKNAYRTKVLIAPF